MNDIPTYIDKIKELGTKKQELIKEIQKLDLEINFVTQQWQKVCDHPETYRTKTQCSACGFNFGVENESVSS